MTSKQSILCWRRIFSVDHLQRHVITSRLVHDSCRELVGNPVDHPHNAVELEIEQLTQHCHMEKVTYYRYMDGIIVELISMQNIIRILKLHLAHL
jgi:hypothetical protein